MTAKIYTKTGDQGQTGLLGGERVAKSDPRIEACGHLDELNAWLGLIADILKEQPRNSASAPSHSTSAATHSGPAETTIRRVQERLFTAGSLLASPPGKEMKFSLPELLPADVAALEKEIDRMDAGLPALKNFILPGGHTLVAQIHIARSVCRRAERSVVLLNGLEPGVPALVFQYLNRLSDYLFVLARATAHELGVPEIPWHPAPPKS